MRNLILITLTVFAQVTALCQDGNHTYTDTEIKALTIGLKCCEQVDILNTKIEVQNDIITNLDQQIANEQAKYNIKHGDWLKADSSLRAYSVQLNGCNSEVERLKKGKRNWQIFGISVSVGTGLMAYMWLK